MRRSTPARLPRKALTALALFALAGTPAPAQAQAPDEIDPHYGFTPLPEIIGWGEDDDEIELAIPRFLAPDLDRDAAARRRAEREGLLRPDFSSRAILRGQTAPAAAHAERAVGWSLGADRFALATSVVTGAGKWQRGDTRLDWNLSHGAGQDDGVIWRLGTGGAFGFAGSGEQRASGMLGYRSQLFDKLTLTSEIAFATSYAFAASQASATLAPQMQIVADFTTALATPWTTQLDVRLRREVPLAEGAYQTQASALLRLKYSLN